MWKSALETAKDPDNIELSLYVDKDDDLTQKKCKVLKDKNVVVTIGPRVVLSKCWNGAYKNSTGEIFMHSGDDLIFRSKNWDQYVLKVFDNYPDKIVFAFGDDGFWKERFGTHGFIHRNWIETTGYFVPPYFSSDFNDTWLNEVAEVLGRKVYMPQVYIEHMHPLFKKAEWDETHLERIERGKKDNVNQLYLDKIHERIADANKLAEFIADFRRNV
jgi:hypothetical protein